MVDPAFPDTRSESPPTPPGGTIVQDSEAARRFAGRVAGALPELPPGYRMVAKLGRGGMGVVFRAVQTELGRDVALKMILSGDYASDEELARFESEVKLVASVKHPNVVQVHHAGRHDGRPFLDLEFVPDGSLADLLRDGPMAARDAADLVAQIADGVAACHAVGIIHRDLKPGNILLAKFVADESTVASSTGTKRSTTTLRTGLALVPKVADFGLAKRLETADGMTRTGAVLGTPSYMPPEQAKGESLDATADVYSLGAILYATLTGRPPFQSPSPDETLRRVIHDDPLPVRVLQPATPRDLETICLKCLAKERGARYATAAELADDLGRWRTGQPIRARRAGLVERGWKFVKRNRTWTAVFLALAVGFGTALWQAVVATRARAATEIESRQKGANSGFFIDVLAQSSAARQAESGRPVDPDLSVKKALDYATENIGKRFAGQPAIEADIRSNIGRIYHELKQYREAAAQFELVLELQDQFLPADHPNRFQVLVSLGDCLLNAGESERALERLTSAHELGERSGGAPVDLFKCLNNIGLAYRKLGRDEDAMSFLQRALAGRRGLLESSRDGAERVALRKEVARSCHNLGRFHYDLGHYGDAERFLLESLRERQELLGNDHPDTVSTVRVLGEVYDWMETRPADAERQFRAALDATKRIEPDTWVEAADRLRLARFYVWQARYDEAGPLIVSGCHCLEHCKVAAPAGMKAPIRQLAKDVRERAAAIGPKRAREWLDKLDELGK
jgi:eukaryotic-like serine/threonine-protein kinase